VIFKQEIERHFGPAVFQRPLFYSYPGGLRFGLSNPGNTLDQFLSALRKATTICKDIFASGPIVVCLRTHSSTCHFEHRRKLGCLKSASVSIPAQRDIWCEPIDPEEWLYETTPEYWVYLAFEIPVSLLETLLWCALAKDFRVIQPNPGCDVYLFNLNKKVLAFPYDDRGMDVVGTNRELLSVLYEKHQRYLLDYDHRAISDTFSSP
jgi:hypothetical protein